VREDVRKQLWEEADRLEWSALSAKDKARYYTIWTETTQLGGRLAAFMDPRQVRVYIKDTLLKAYTRERFSDPVRVFRVLGLPLDARWIETYIKPHGRRLADGRQIAWSRATEWKATLLALHERAYEYGGMPYGAVLFEARTKHADPSARAVVESAREKLGIERLVWLD
jgi:hypothetical protein